MKTKFYPLSDLPNLNELTKLCRVKIYPKERGGVVSQVRAKLTGEKRPPKKGEWYVSGAIPEAYRAPNDLSTDEAIAVLVRVAVKTIEEEIK